MSDITRLYITVPGETEQKPKKKVKPNESKEPQKETPAE